MYLGREIVDGKVTGHLVGYQGDGHMLTIGPTRSGKSRRLLIPNLLYETGRSALIIDVKGELAANSAAQRAAKGSRVIALYPFDVLPGRGLNIPRVGFNPMARLEPSSDDFVDDAMALAEAIVQVKPGEHDPHWSESAQDLVAALIMLGSCTFGKKATLISVRREVCRSAEDMALLANKVIERDVHPAITNKLAKFASSVGNAGKNEELSSIISNAQTQTRFLDSPAIARNISTDGVDFSILKSQKCTVYLVLPPERLITHAKWLRLIISAAMTSMQQTLRIPDRPDVVFILDVFPQLGRLTSIETAVSLNAGYGVKVWASIQHLGQLKEQYGANWETFLSAGCVTAFSPRDLFTRDHLTALIGQGEKAVKSTSYSSDGGVSVSSSMEKDDLVTPHEWRQMIMGEHWAFIPTDKGQVIKKLFAVDFTRLPALA